MLDDRPQTETVPLSLIARDAEQPSGVVLFVYHRDGAEVATLHPERDLVVGRAAPADLVVPDVSLSRQHARFCLIDNRVVVEDLGSTNGTWMAGKTITTVTVDPGTVITLGATTAVLKPLGEEPLLGLAGHDRFAAALALEVSRARFFGRTLALAVIRAVGKEPSPVHLWLERVQRFLRPVDQVALYSADTVELMLPEMSLDAAITLGAAIAEGGEPELAFAVSAFPESSTTAEGLLDAGRSALRKASSSQRVSVAEPSTTVVFDAPIDESDADGELVAESRAMREALELARRLARGVIPVLLHGETGTGKEVLARFIHDQGPRKHRPLVAVNCAAIPQQLVESELFGHEKGAFTGATHMKKGVFEAAHGGSVLLDEIGELPPQAQAALLRVLETKRVTRVGSTKEIDIDVRIMAASHRDLEAMCMSGAFREDLLYRLNALTLEVPPLRERQQDIAPLVRRFLEQANQVNGRNIVSIEPNALQALLSYDWPGNVRELRNAVERAGVIAEQDVVTLRDLPQRLRESADDLGIPSSPPAELAPAQPRESEPSVSGWREGEPFHACMARLEATVLVAALRYAGGNQSEAARVLRMPRRTLVHKLKLHGIKKGGYSVDPG